MPTAVWNDTVIAEAPQDAVKIVENNVYFPPDAVDQSHLVLSDTQTRCHWKGTASYYHVSVDGKINRDAAWVYRNPLPEAGEIAGHIAFWRGVDVSR
ncbi:DUF427 domain-containing protein [Noviherbaspirillum galbum]|uniref:DUF427 domain-containing protein n=1 Tax=Noviherbaspirillum galbum TaxID=2709383 RepID=A0A6B3SUN5_9BURK|nr:DUF427 domain-containing protein [Noviherbaspirillum galbum]NEX64740.1 DUF427 domain-containing protein [Noviherbaspirillum galbum]